MSPAEHALAMAWAAGAQAMTEWYSNLDGWTAGPPPENPYRTEAVQ